MSDPTTTVIYGETHTHPSGGPGRFLSGVGTIVALELRQRVKGTAAWVLLGVFVVLVGLVTAFSWIALNGFDPERGSGVGVYSVVIFFVLLLGTLVTPALSGNAINGDRDAGTLATTQVTLITTGQLLLGKFIAAWITALAFLAASVPFILVALFSGEIQIETILVSLLVLAVELGVVAAVGVGLSGVISKPLFSIVTTYLIVAALSVGTLIAFSLGGMANQSTIRSTYIPFVFPEDGSEPTECGEPEVTEYQVPRFDYFWGALSANPYVILADASPSTYESDGNGQDLFTHLKCGVRASQFAPDLDITYSDCDPRINSQGFPGGYKSSQELIENSVPSWFVGLSIHLALAIGLMALAWRRVRTPARKLSKGSRIA